MKPMVGGRGLLIAVMVLVGTAAVAGAAGSGVITSCVNKSTGALRIIGASGSCKATEVKLAWNIQGPPGPAGPSGPQGNPGPTGPQGPQGASGISFGDTLNGGGSLNNCLPTVILSTTIAITTPARIEVTGAGSYSYGTTNLLTGSLQVVLRDALNTQTLASALSAQGTAPFNEGSTPFSTYIASTGVLKQGSDPFSPAFVASPGSYILQLVGTASVGTCTGSPVVLNASLTYLLIGTT